MAEFDEFNFDASSDEGEFEGFTPDDIIKVKMSPLYACSLTSIGHDDRFLFNNPRVQ
jgi:hypothetical protein